MKSPSRLYQPPPIPDDPVTLQNELHEAHETIHRLLRQISKEQSRCAEVARAYNKTVANLMEITRENAVLEHERDQWKARVESAAAPFRMGSITIDLTPDEVSAIRKAMARLHHPDAGGDAERMKTWNAALDPLED
ncbi:MAG: hypothetical protein JST60_18230 [Chloroflexi bacterium SZAS-1]|jgi:chromosome segregation ATPase|nr:hypothetical protein [Chloroflexi bacterium SZAS-1]HNP85637.1 hypothetical protein [Kouleothrix sp.]